MFGSSSTFGGTSGFGGFAAVEKQPAEHEEGGEEATAGEGEEDCSAEFKPLVQLEEVERVSGEEAEDVLLDLCAQIISALYSLSPCSQPGGCAGQLHTGHSLLSTACTAGRASCIALTTTAANGRSAAWDRRDC